MLTLPEHKRGQTFVLEANLKDAAGKPLTNGLTKLKSQVRDKAYALKGEAVITAGAIDGCYILTIADTSQWTPGDTLYADIRYDDGATVSYSETFSFLVGKEMTRDDSPTG